MAKTQQQEGTSKSTFCVVIRTFLSSFWHTESSFVKRYGCLRVHQDKGVYIPVHRTPLSEEKRKSILAFRAITGCDTTNQFYGVGKASAWKVFEDAPDLSEHLGEQAKSVLTFLPKLKPLCANCTIREHKRWKSTKKEQQRFANPRKISTTYLRLKMH